jgi:hypothetical protein
MERTHYSDLPSSFTSSLVKPVTLAMNSTDESSFTIDFVVFFSMFNDYSLF